MSESLSRSGKKLWDDIVKKWHFGNLGAVPPESWYRPYAGLWQYLKIHRLDMHDSDGDQGWDLKDCFEAYSMSVHTISLELKRWYQPKFWNFGYFDNSGGAVPGICTPKWNLGWYSDSWKTFGKMMYTYVRVCISLRKEVMRGYSEKVENIDGFIIYMICH